MNLPVAPTPVRRTFQPLIMLLEIAFLIIIGAFSGLMVLLGMFPFARKAIRLCIMATGLIGLDLFITLGCWRLWLLRRFGRSDPATWRTDHIRLLGDTLDRYVRVAQRVVGFRVAATDLTQPLYDDEPVLFLARHAGPGDSLLIAWLISHELHRAPRVVLKRFLMWDPAIDLIIHRLDGYFLPPKGTPAAQRKASLTAFCASMGPHDGAKVFPEGQNWTPARHAAAIESDRASDDPEAAMRVAWLERHPTVLTPRVGAAANFIDAVPGLRVICIWHAGVEDLHTLKAVWAAIPLQEPAHVRFTERRPVPTGPALKDYLYQEWGDLDDWSRQISHQPARPGERPLYTAQITTRSFLTQLRASSRRAKRT